LLIALPLCKTYQKALLTKSATSNTIIRCLPLSDGAVKDLFTIQCQDIIKLLTKVIKERKSANYISIGKKKEEQFPTSEDELIFEYCNYKSKSKDGEDYYILKESKAISSMVRIGTYKSPRDIITLPLKHIRNSNIFFNMLSVGSNQFFMTDNLNKSKRLKYNLRPPYWFNSGIFSCGQLISALYNSHLNNW
jgi:hypothetical protein